MHYSYPPLHVILFGLLPAIIPPYALRLSRVVGTRRAGWILFAVFSALAGLQLVRTWQPVDFGFDQWVMVDALNFVVTALLLVGMAHVEVLSKERLRLEQEEKKLRIELERQVQEKTMSLAQANEELRKEIANLRDGGAAPQPA
jgi:cell division protein FtsB